jgi:hypothetical protein
MNFRAISGWKSAESSRVHNSDKHTHAQYSDRLSRAAILPVRQGGLVLWHSVPKTLKAKMSVTGSGTAGTLRLFLFRAVAPYSMTFIMRSLLISFDELGF